jgi:hypothetical protein
MHDDSDLMLDGNALAGALRDVFVHEMTTARVACKGCGRAESIGAERAFTRGPGFVLRCRHCDGVLLVMTQAGGRLVLGFEGLRWLEIVDEPLA